MPRKSKHKPSAKAEVGRSDKISSRAKSKPGASSANRGANESRKKALDAPSTKLDEELTESSKTKPPSVNEEENPKGSVGSSAPGGTSSSLHTSVFAADFEAIGDGMAKAGDCGWVAFTEDPESDNDSTDPEQPADPTPWALFGSATQSPAATPEGSSPRTPTPAEALFCGDEAAKVGNEDGASAAVEGALSNAEPLHVDSEDVTPRIPDDGRTAAQPAAPSPPSAGRGGGQDDAVSTLKRSLIPQTDASSKHAVARISPFDTPCKQRGKSPRKSPRAQGLLTASDPNRFTYADRRKSLPVGTSPFDFPRSRRALLADRLSPFDSPRVREQPLPTAEHTPANPSPFDSPRRVFSVSGVAALKAALPSKKDKPVPIVAAAPRGTTVKSSDRIAEAGPRPSFGNSNEFPPISLSDLPPLVAGNLDTSDFNSVVHAFAQHAICMHEETIGGMQNRIDDLLSEVAALKRERDECKSRLKELQTNASALGNHIDSMIANPAFREDGVRELKDMLRTKKAHVRKVLKQRELDRSMCSRCKIRKRGVAFIPCGHIRYCGVCGGSCDTCVECGSHVTQVVALISV